MKLTSKIFYTGLVNILVLTINSPTALALERSENREKERSDRAMISSTENLCTRIEQLTTRIINQTEEQKNRIENKRSDNEQAISERKQSQQEKIAEKRLERDEQRAAHYDKLNERAETNAQKAAVEKFQTTVENAVKVRKSKVDSAMATFRTGVQSIVTARKASYQTALTKMKTAVQAAVSEAKTSCDSGSDPAVIKTTLQTKLQAAREQFMLDRQKVEKAGPQVEALTKTRNDAVKQAIEDFKTTLETAKTELKKAFETTTN